MASNRETAHPTAVDPRQMMRVVGIGCLGGRNTLLRIIEKIAGSMPPENSETLRTLHDALQSEDTTVAGFQVLVETGGVRVVMYTRHPGGSALQRQRPSPPASVERPSFP